MGPSVQGDERLHRAIAAIDAANADDPATIVVRGVTRPKEQAHAELMTDWVTRLDPQSSEAQLMAARAHHLRRWSLPRATYPEGRAGYLRWRKDLQRQHAEEVATILEDAGYDGATIERVQAIVRKERLRTDPAVQVHEDALCLVFLETQLAELVDQLGDEKAGDVIAKTVDKMSDEALAAAAGLDMRPGDQALVEAALSRPRPRRSG